MSPTRRQLFPSRGCSSTFTTVTSRRSATGRPGPAAASLTSGFTPRAYFDNPEASALTDVAREAGGLAEWWARYRAAADDADPGAKAAELVTYLAADIDPTELDHDDEDDEGLDDADIFVEVKTARFLATLDLPSITELPK